MTNNQIKILMNGICGKMGKAMTAGLAKEPDMQVIAGVDVKGGVDIGALCGMEPNGILVETDLTAAIKQKQPDVIVDFTNPQVVMKNIRTALEHKTPIIVGSTGITEDDLTTIESLSKQYDTQVFIAPNFALGAILMMKFAQEAAAYFPHVEVIERHHDQKLDAPSGTAIKTMEMMSGNRGVFAQGAANEFEKINGSRGGDFQGMRVHSVRLPGYVATQEVVFGGLGQILTIKHDAISRETYLPGLILALRKIKELKGLVYGLEKIM